MKNLTLCSIFMAAVALCAAGCQSSSNNASTTPAAMNPVVPTGTTSASSDAISPLESTGGIIRVAAGAVAPVKDSEGNVWLPDQGFSGGDIIQRPDLVITNTQDPMIYQAEHYGMDSFSCKLPNGKYQVKLHFAETFEGITGPGQRVFSFDVQGQEFKDFDVWKNAGGPMTAYVVTCNVEVTNGQLLINFVTNIENPQINGIEIIPAT